jgi:hypothetical protein
LWRTVAGELGIELSFVTMLRHPAEVAGSRDRAYLTDHTAEFRRKRETANVASWCNGAFETERATRTEKRVFVHYGDLVSDWRRVMEHIGSGLGLTFNADLSAGKPHPVDDFVDKHLYRAQVTWDETDVPGHLRDNAERVWAAMTELVDDPSDARAIADLADLRGEYTRIYDDAEAIALDHTNAQMTMARRSVRSHLKLQHRKELDAVRRRLAEASKQLDQLTGQLDPTPPSPEASSQRLARRLRSRT